MRNKVIMIIISVIIIIVGAQIIKNKYKNNTIEQHLITGNKPYYVFVGKIDIEDIKYNKKIISSYDEYIDLSNYYESEYLLKENDFDNYDYLSIIIENDYCNSKIKGIEDISISSEVDVLVNIDGSCSVCTLQNYLYLVRIKKNSISNQNINIKYQNIKNCKKK